MSTGKNNIIVKVGDDGRSSFLRLNIEDKLERIRKILEEDEKIKMDDKLSFSRSTDSSDVVTRNKESDLILDDIIKNKTLCLIPNLTKRNIRVKVVGDDGRSSLLRFNIEDKLKIIRKILKEDEKIKMNDKLSFSRSTDFSDVVTRDEESNLFLKGIIKDNTLYLIPTIRVKVAGEDGRSSLLRLNIEDKLEIIRKILEEDEKIKMDDKLSFLWSTDSSDKKVTRNEESDLSLRDIIKNNNTLCLIKKDDHTDFKDRLKLGYGRILTPNKINIETSKEEVCTMEMEIIVLDNGGDKKDGDFRSKKGWANKISMFFDGKVEMMNYGPEGLSLYDDINYQTEEKETYKFTKVPKITLKLDKFQPKHNFIKEVEKALKSNNQENFDKIYEDFGQFIPTEVTLGGIDYYETSPNITLTEVLEERDTWECIEFRNPKSIFEILNKELRKQLYEFFGKKILYGNVISRKCHLKYGKKEIVNLPLEVKFLEMINNKKVDCSVFATVVDDEEKKNDFINCQIYYPQNERPQLIIHCFQKNNQTSRWLKIAFMVVGYDIHFNPNNFNDFNKTKLEVLKNTRLFESESSFLGIPVLKELNDEPIVVGHYFSKNNENNNIEVNVFSYNLRKKQCVEQSSNFNFHVLTISKNTKTSEKKNYEPEKNSVTPDYISVYFKNGSRSPVFLKKKRKEIKLKNVTCKCNKSYISKKISKSKNCILCENISGKGSKINKYIYSQL